jgi:hypothetical protein
MPRYRQSERRWVHAACVAGVYPVLVAIVFILRIGAGVSLPVSVAVAAPPLIYAAIAMVLLRDAALVRRLSWVGAACVVHMGLGALAATELAWATGLSYPGALAQVFVLFPPASVLTLVATPITLWAFNLTETKPPRKVEAAARPAAARSPRPKPIAPPGRLGKVVPEPGAASAQSARPSTAVNAAVAAPLTARPSLLPPPTPAPAAAAPAPVVAAAPVAPIASRPPKPAPRRDDGMVRVSFARLAPQLPAEAFVLPIERLGESLREPNVVLVPRRVVLSQMRGGAVAITWGHIASQFPDLALGMADDEFRKQYPDLKLWLPADELVSQLPPGAMPGTTAAEAPVIDGPVAVAPTVPVTPPSPSIPTNGESTATTVGLQDRELLERAVACFNGVGSFEASVQRLGGTPVVMLVEPSLPRDAVTACAGQLLRCVAGADGDVLTARTEQAALVLAVAATPIVVAARLPGAPVALLVLRAVRAAAGAGDGAPRVQSPAGRALEPLAVDSRLAQAAQALRSLGAVERTAFADGAARVYVLRAGGAEDKAVAALALDVCQTLGASGALGRLRAVMLRRGGEQTLIRPLAGTAGVLAASGTVTRPGRLLRDAERAARILEDV